ncbi:tail fiber protein [Escherichia phage phiKT]|uniref:Tail fiber protein n=1 Tax=Escherichia phage phiKT TaxID=1141519 RepID=H6VUB9_BPPKT|nr:tail fiber protein [Escherichia phage phiKT]AEZ65107.1 tail fiber protein [Escherichia phage phiKT]
MAITFYATNNFTGDGTTVNWNINFADGYIDTTDVKARYLDNTGSYVDIAISSVAGNVVTISPAVADGQEFQIYRDTEKRFPLVDFSDGAILNETNLDTLATQAVMVSAEAFDQSNNGVRIAGDSLTIAQGIDAKAQLALDNSEAAVATANGIDGKAQTALNTAAAAVATANAATSTAAGAVSTANTALSTANDAADDAATAVTTANAAVTTANAATTTANAASAAASAATTTANNAANDAATAVSTANTALSTANTASTNASTAVSTANAAKATAEGIEAKADSALAASANAVTTANAAEATANAIDGKATDALNTADAAEATANTAAATASSAAADASTALSTVTAADTKAQTALDNIASLDAATMKKAANLSDIADKAAAWLNVRPIGSTPLAGDPVGDYDAVTKRWVENLINTGTVGPTMNGVMNYGVGDFHLRDSRAYIQPYEVVSDGQLLNRADWPELWSYAQMLSPITDADWLADPQKRGKYSLGNGATTFRVPDRNGVQAGSIAALFGRGDGGVSSSDGTILDSAAPNITGSFGRLVYASTGTIYEGNTGTGAFSAFSPQAKYKKMSDLSSIDAQAAEYPSGYEFFASNSSPVYGRGSTEVRPKAFTGVWVIRASGGFVAANTLWSVINGDATKPANNTSVNGGEIQSEYRIGTQVEGKTSLRFVGTIGQAYAARLNVSNNSNTNAFIYDFDEYGRVNFGKPGGVIKSGDITLDMASNGDFYVTTTRLRVEHPTSGGQTMGISTQGGANRGADQGWFEHWGNSYGGGSDKSRATVVELKIGTGYAWYSQKLASGVYETRFASAIYATAFTQNSDERIKENIERISDPLEKMKQIKGVSWNFKTVGNAKGYGFIAQDVERVLPEAVSVGGGELELTDGTKVSDVKSVNTSGVAAALHHEAILALMDKVEALEARIAELTSQ